MQEQYGKVVEEKREETKGEIWINYGELQKYECTVLFGDDGNHKP